MRHQIYCIRDNKASVYNLPWFASSLPVALRNIGRAVYDEESQLSIFPQDFDLFKLGEYDDQQGKFVIEGPPEYVTSLQNVKMELEEIRRKIDKKGEKNGSKSQDFGAVPEIEKNKG